MRRWVGVNELSQVSSGLIQLRAPRASRAGDEIKRAE
jgi:hypothetical protein